MNYQERAKFDCALKIDVLRVFNELSHVTGVTIECPWPISWRIFSCYVFNYYTTDVEGRKQFVNMMWDTDTFQHDKKLGVEGKIFLTGFILTELSENETKLEYFIQIDAVLKGVPQWFIRMATGVIAKCPFRFVDWIEDEYIKQGKLMYKSNVPKEKRKNDKTLNVPKETHKNDKTLDQEIVEEKILEEKTVDETEATLSTKTKLKTPMRKGLISRKTEVSNRVTNQLMFSGEKDDSNEEMTDISAFDLSRRNIVKDVRDFSFQLCCKNVEKALVTALKEKVQYGRKLMD